MLPPPLGFALSFDQASSRGNLAKVVGEPIPEGPSTQYLRFLVPIKRMLLGTWTPGPSIKGLPISMDRDRPGAPDAWNWALSCCRELPRRSPLCRRPLRLPSSCWGLLGPLWGIFVTYRRVSFKESSYQPYGCRLMPRPFFVVIVVILVWA